MTEHERGAFFGATFYDDIPFGPDITGDDIVAAGTFEFPDGVKTGLMLADGRWVESSTAPDRPSRQLVAHRDEPSWRALAHGADL